MSEGFFRIVVKLFLFCSLVTLSANFVAGQCGPDGTQPCGENTKQPLKNKSAKAKSSAIPPKSKSQPQTPAAKPKQILTSNQTEQPDPKPQPETPEQQAAGFYRKGVFCKYEDFNCAIENYTKAIELNQKNWEYFYKRADKYEQRADKFKDSRSAIETDRDYDAAIKDFGKAIELHPVADNYYQRGYRYYYKNKFEDAIRDFKRALELEPDNKPYNSFLISSYNNLISSYEKLDRHDEIIKIYADLIAANPKDWENYSNRARYFENRLKKFKDKRAAEENARDYRQITEDYTKAIEQHPVKNNYFSRGYIFYQQSNFKEAIKDFSKAIELDSSDSVNYYFRGRSLKELSKYDEAIKDYTKAIELRPVEDNYFWRGEAYYYKRDYEEAIKDFTKAIELDSNDHFNYSFRSRSYEALGKTALAEADKNKSEELKRAQPK